MWVPHLLQGQLGFDERAKGTYHESSILETEEVKGRSSVVEGKPSTCPSGGKLSHVGSVSRSRGTDDTLTSAATSPCDPHSPSTGAPRLCHSAPPLPHS
jgi:hypothetical protein